MNFEQALTIELSSIPQLVGKVFPLHAPEGVEPTFVIYTMTDPGYIEDFSGQGTTRDSRYEIDIISPNYGEMKDIYELVKNKLLSMEFRTIGGSNIYIQSVTLEMPQENFEEKVDWHRTHFEMKLFFEE
jgi:hypothetical protein